MQVGKNNQDQSQAGAGNVVVGRTYLFFPLGSVHKGESEVCLWVGGTIFLFPWKVYTRVRVCLCMSCTVIIVVVHVFIALSGRRWYSGQCGMVMIIIV